MYHTYVQSDFQTDLRPRNMSREALLTRIGFFKNCLFIVYLIAGMCSLRLYHWVVFLCGETIKAF